jgi:hypothetical protein
MKPSEVVLLLHILPEKEQVICIPGFLNRILDLLVHGCSPEAV